MNTSVQDSNEAALRRIQRTSSLLHRICTVLLVASCIFPVIGIIAMATGHLTTIAIPGKTISLAQLTTPGRIVLEIASLVAVGLVIKALYHLRLLLGHYSRREVFTVDSARQIRQFGISCTLWGALKVVLGFVTVIYVADPTLTGIHVDWDTLLIGAVIVVLSWFAEMAATLREENDLTI